MPRSRDNLVGPIHLTVQIVIYNMRHSLRRNQSFVPILVSKGGLTPVGSPDTFTGIVPVDAAGNYPVDAAGNIPTVPDN